MRLAALILLVACDASDATPDATLPGDACAASFSGNYTETASVPGCASLRDGALTLAIPSTTIDASYAISIDLGTGPTLGTYTSQTLQIWRSLATEVTSITGECVFSAGAAAVPTGNFQLRLDSLSPLHGEVSIVHYVLALPDTTCGAGDTETVDVQF